MVGGGTIGRDGAVSGETCRRGDGGRSQSLHSTDAVQAVRGVESKATPREGRQEGGNGKAMPRQSASEVTAVPARAKQGTDTWGRDWSWVEATVWTDRMLTALEHGVQGGCWFSLIDKVYRLETLRGGWQQVQSNAGAAGVDRQSVQQFATRTGFTRRRLRAILRKQEHRPGRGKCLADHQRWPNTFFAAQGLFTMTTAHAFASRSR